MASHFFSNNLKGVGHWTTERINSIRPNFNKVLDVGCGGRKIPGSFGIDSWKGSQADLIQDLNQSWNIPSDSYDEVFCLNFLEHTFSFDHCLNEIYRVLKKGGIAHIEVPYYNSYNFGRVPFHYINFAENTIEDFFGINGEFNRYSKARFHVIEKEFYFSKPAKLIPSKLRLPLSHYIGNLCYQIYWKVKK